MSEYRLPGVLGEIAEACGEDVALKLAGEFGGTEIHVPQSPEPHHRLSVAVGLDAARRISALFGHGTLVVPLGPFASWREQRGRIAALLADGVPHDQIARRIGCHRRTIERVAAARKGGE